MVHISTYVRGIVVFISIILQRKKGHFVMFNYNEWKVYWIYLSGKLNRWFVLHVIWEWKREGKNQHQPILRKLPMIYMVIYFNCGYWTVFAVLGLKKIGCPKNVCSFFIKLLLLPQRTYYMRAKKKWITIVMVAIITIKLELLLQTKFFALKLTQCNFFRANNNLEVMWLACTGLKQN